LYYTQGMFSKACSEIYKKVLLSLLKHHYRFI
jgi:hypothetical protein